MFPTAAVRVASGATKTWKLRDMTRVTCPECGTRLFADKPELGIRGVCAALLPPGTFKPAFHIQCQYALRPVRDELPHFKAFPARFGGKDELVDW
jgi:hypothetical protein